LLTDFVCLKIITLVSESMDMSNNGLVSVVGWCLTQGSATFQIWRELTFLAEAALR
jgi:hypothetical protein